MDRGEKAFVSSVALLFLGAAGALAYGLTGASLDEVALRELGVSLIVAAIPGAISAGVLGLLAYARGASKRLGVVVGIGMFLLAMAADLGTAAWFLLVP